LPGHVSLRQHLIARAERGHVPVFEPSDDRTLVEFERVSADLGVYSLDVNKTVPEDELSASYELSAETVRTEGGRPEIVYCHWSPVEPGQELVEGFLVQPNSPLFGSAPTEGLPPQELIAALLLLVTTDYVHLSASREQTPPLVRGAVRLASGEFDYVVLDLKSSQDG